MTDYLTQLARRSLGELRPVKPVRIHPYAESTAPDDGRFEGSIPETVESGIAATERSRGSRAGDTLVSPRPASGQTRSTPRSGVSTAADVAQVRAGWVEDRRRTDGSWPAEGSDENPSAGAEGRTGPPSRLRNRDHIDDEELLVPRRPRGREEFRNPETGASSTGSEERTAGPSPGPPPATNASERSSGPAAGSQEDPRGSHELEALPDRSSVEVSIGTIEIRALPPQSPQAIPHARRVKPKLALDEYLAQRRRGER